MPAPYSHAVLAQPAAVVIQVAQPGYHVAQPAYAQQAVLVTPAPTLPAPYAPGVKTVRCSAPPHGDSKGRLRVVFSKLAGVLGAKVGV